MILFHRKMLQNSIYHHNALLLRNVSCRYLSSSSSATTTAAAAAINNSFVEEDIKSQLQSQHSSAIMQRKNSGIDIGEVSRLSINLKLDHTPGSLEGVLRQFWKYDFNLTRIESRPSIFDQSKFDFFVDFEGNQDDPNVKKLLSELNKTCTNVNIMGPKSVPWFPRHIKDLDSFTQKTLDAGEELDSDHPGFSDTIYRERREKIVANAATYRYGNEIPRVEYSESEIKTWGEVYGKLKGLFPKYACKEYKAIIGELEEHCGYSETNIPQLQDITEYMKKKTGFQLRPVSGLLSARDFLNALAFRSFFSTQYIRHHSKPFYTPEPDICHEAIGHVPLLCNPDFAELSQQYGLASLGASDRDIERLATCYWFSVEFGLCKEGSDIKAYGAGLLSSFGEMEWACKAKKDGENKPKILPWDPSVAASLEYPITTYQPTYFLADSLRDASEKLKQFSEEHVIRPFHMTYLPYSQAIHCDRAVKRVKYTTEVE